MPLECVVWACFGDMVADKNLKLRAQINWWRRVLISLALFFQLQAAGSPPHEQHSAAHASSDEGRIFRLHRCSWLSRKGALHRGTSRFDSKRTASHTCPSSALV